MPKQENKKNKKKLKRTTLFFKAQRLYRLSVQTLMGYHTPLGAVNRVLIAREMLRYIICQRKDIFILRLPFTVINLKKATAAVFKEGTNRGTLLVYVSSLKNFFYEDNATFLFVKTWVGGILTNFKRVVRHIQINHRLYRMYRSIFLTRPQLYNLSHIQYQYKSFYKSMVNRKSVMLKIPSLALSVNNDDVWTNELRNSGIPSIQLLDADTPTMGNISYGIIGNQGSISLAKLLCDLMIESCGKGMLTEHLFKLKVPRFHRKLRTKEMQFSKRKATIKFNRISDNIVRSVKKTKPKAASTLNFAYSSVRAYANKKPALKHTHIRHCSTSTIFNYSPDGVHIVITTREISNRFPVPSFPTSTYDMAHPHITLYSREIDIESFVRNGYHGIKPFFTYGYQGLEFGLRYSTECFHGTFNIAVKAIYNGATILPNMCIEFFL